jgi:hypothetical protein
LVIGHSFPVLGELLGRADIGVLARLVATDQQDHERPAALHEVDAIAGAIMDAQLRDAVPDGLRVAEIPCRETSDAGVDPRPRPPVTKPREPSLVGGALDDLDSHMCKL